LAEKKDTQSKGDEMRTAVVPAGKKRSRRGVG